MSRATLVSCIVVTMIATACSNRNAEGALTALAEGNLEQAREIYAGGVDPNEQVKGQTALTMVACYVSPEVIDLLLESGADPNLPNRKRLTPLIRAAECGNLPAVKALLDGGAEIDLSSPGGKTALAFAREAGKEDVVQFLLDAGAQPGRITSTERRKATGY